MFNDTLIILCSDHGGISKYHGRNSPAENTTPLILYGACLPVHGIMPDKITSYDITALITWALAPWTIDDPFFTTSIWDGQPILTPFFNIPNSYKESKKYND